MLALVQSNRLEALAEALAITLREQPLAPLAAEIIVVPSAGIGRWLGFELADRLGIIANTRFAFPASYVWSLFADVLPQVPRQSPFDPGRMIWRLMRLLGRTRADAAFASVAHYLASGAIGQRADLARALAARFDAYAAYRPEWLEGWLAGRRYGLGEHEAWQAILWRELAADAPHLPHIHPKEAFFSNLDTNPAARDRLPARISLFGVDSIAPLYLEIIERLGEYVDVVLYLLSPSREYWGHIVRPRTIARTEVAEPLAASYLESGNRLFASLGQHGRALFDALAARAPPGVEHFPAPDGNSLLATLQGDILALHDRGPADRIVLAPEDTSVRIHVCHGAVREAEVLHDQLLELLDANHDLQPHDVLVLCPDLEAYGGALDAVFASMPPDRSIPYSIADRPFDAERPIARTFFTLIDCGRGRLGAESVVALLDEAVIGRRFRIGLADLPQVRDWVANSGIRWGLDASAREVLDLPATDDHSWHAGVDRLVLGAAFAPGAIAAFEGIVPFEDIEGGATRLLGSLIRFVAALGELGRVLRAGHSLADWSLELATAIDRFIAPAPDDENDLQSIREALRALADDARTSGFDEAVPIDVVLRELRDRLTVSSRTGAFLAGGVTIASLASGRVVPSRVVCLVGMNDGAFPRLDRPHGFDLISAHPRSGDRRRRDEDRYAFLSAVLAARESLLISYSGRSVRDNATLAPSVVVGELFDAIRATARTEDGEVLRRLTTEHPLHPFSAAYQGGDPKLFTYASEWQHVDARVEAGKFAVGPPVGAPLTLDPDAHAVGLLELCRFFIHPARFFLRERTGIAIETLDRELDSTEPFSMDGLSGFRVRDNLVETALDASGIDPTVLKAARSFARGAGLLPHAAAGTAAFDREQARAAVVATRILNVNANQGAVTWLPSLDWTLEIGTWRLSGVFSRLTSGGLLHWRVGRYRADDLLRLWIGHLALNALTPPEIEPAAILIASDKTARLRPVGIAAARAQLAELLAIYGDGLTSLVPFYPRTSHEWVRAERSGKDPTRAVRGAWLNDGFGSIRGESEDAYVSLAVRGDPNPLGEAFRALARRIYLPIFDVLELT